MVSMRSRKFAAAAVVALAAIAVAAVQACLPPPYLYITFHAGSGPQQVGAWTRDGCALPSPVDNGGGAIQEPRGMLIRDSDSALLLADAGHMAGRVMVFSACDANGARTYQANYVTQSTYPGLDHPYGIAFNSDADIFYASNQDTNVVLAFNNINSASPRPPASYLNGSAQYTAEFAQFEAGSNGVRGVAVDDLGYVWIASEDDGGVYQFDPATGAPRQFVPLDSAVGVHFYNDTGYVYASSHSKKDAQVVAIDPVLGQVVATYVCQGEGHPAGIVGYQNALFVVGQDTGSLFAFDTSSAASTDAPQDGVIVVPALGGTGEQIILSPC